MFPSDASFDRSNWKEKKSDVINYFNDKFAGRAHMLYTGQFIGCKVLSTIFIVSGQNAYFLVNENYQILHFHLTFTTAIEHVDVEHDNTRILDYIFQCHCIFDYG